MTNLYHLLIIINIKKDKKMKNFIIFFKTIVIFILLTSKAHAYIDPGIGSIILQGIIASIAAIGVFFSNLRNKVLESITKIKKYIFRDKKNDIKK